MTAPVPSPPENELAGLDRPQRLGFLPTTGFWKRRDVKRVAAPLIGAFAFLWYIMLGLLVTGSIPLWASGLLAGVGVSLLVGLLERYLRYRIRRRRSLESAPDSTDARESLLK